MKERRGGNQDHVTVREADHVTGRGADAVGHVTGSATDRGRDVSGRRKRLVLQVRNSSKFQNNLSVIGKGLASAY